ncbi:MAG: hypothetical protein ABJE79_13900, partial [Marinomonas sp.]
STITFAPVRISLVEILAINPHSINLEKRLRLAYHVSLKVFYKIFKSHQPTKGQKSWRHNNPNQQHFADI